MAVALLALCIVAIAVIQPLPTTGTLLNGIRYRHFDARCTVWYAYASNTLLQSTTESAADDNDVGRCHKAYMHTICLCILPGV